MSEFTEATYSPEDNKLRLYPVDRLEQSTYDRIKAAGFRWAPKQELFVAPAWSPNREDLCEELAGEIQLEGMSLADRAEAKAKRLDALSEKRASESSAYFEASQRIMAKFETGQPILVGHHSERKARNDQKKIERAVEQSAKALSASNYWGEKAENVERHANYKARPEVRQRRIKKLFADMRKFQSAISEAEKIHKLWAAIDKMERGEKFDKVVDNYVGGFNTAPRGMYSRRRDENLSTQQVAAECLEWAEKRDNSNYNHRWVAHILGRIGFEHSFLPQSPRFSGDMTPVIIQTFLRTHGADKPKATKQGDLFSVKASSTLPAHIGEGTEIALTGEQWADLMEGCNYEVVQTARRKSSKPKAPPLINLSPEDAQKLQDIWNAEANKSRGTASCGTEVFGNSSEILKITQKVYSHNSKGDYSNASTIEIDEYGLRVWARYGKTEQVAIARVRKGNSSKLYGADRVISLTDKPFKPLPELSPIPKQEAAA